MYIKKIEIKNIRSISEFTMEFPEGKEAGWHVLIGDNGAGKSTIVRSASAVLIGPEEIGSVRQFWEEWLSQGQDSGTITLELVYDPKYDKTDHTPSPKEKVITNAFQLKRNSRVHMESNINAKSMNPKSLIGEIMMDGFLWHTALFEGLPEETRNGIKYIMPPRKQAHI